MLNVILIDDEVDSRELLKSLLKMHCPSVKVVGEANSVKSALKEIADKKPQLVFLDIQMPKGNGFQLLEELEELEDISFDIIFVTSFDKYAISAIKFSALDYILKPISTDELQNAVNKAIKKAEKETQFLLYKNLLYNINPKVTDKKMVIHSNNSAFFIQMSKVLYVEADGNYSTIFMTDGSKHHTAKTLKEIEEFTERDPYFIRVNKSIVINALNFSHYQKGEPYLVVLRSGQQFEISRRKRSEVLEKLKVVV